MTEPDYMDRSTAELSALLWAELQSLKDGLATKDAGLGFALEALSGDSEARAKVQAALDSPVKTDMARVLNLMGGLAAHVQGDYPDLAVPLIGQAADTGNEWMGPAGHQPDQMLSGATQPGPTLVGQPIHGESSSTLDAIPAQGVESQVLPEGEADSSSAQ